ncbi:MAG TPA: hypothetical protein VK131_10165, partial [Candidatus Acidoferrales bacterium]|nr:hypothetical protein [Candidatus Acidoferrales bacterium]
MTQAGEERRREAWARRLYEAFTPLDPDERLPRELLLQGRARTTGRREIAGLAWLPALMLVWLLVGWAGGTFWAAL